MSSLRTESEHPVSADQLAPLNERQRKVYSAKLARFSTYLETEGKEPKRSIGYSDGAVTERVSRFHRAVKWLWSTEGITTEIGIEDVDKINNALEEDRLQKLDGEPYVEGSKRKFNDVLRNWCAFLGEDWQPEYEFSDDAPAKENRPDPFRKEELKRLTEAALTYKTIPSYNNLSPDERDRWKAHIAQELGKPKEDVRPADWDHINHSWKIPSLVRTSRGHGWRPDLVRRLKVQWYDSKTQTIHIPAGEAPKNDAPWNVELTDEEALYLENWLDQRELMERYDGRDEIWLNRKANPYDSGPLNDLLDNLMEEADIETRGRKLVWYSFRHSIGTYVYDEYRDLEIVAEQLRQTTTSAASKYVHKLPELKREAAELM
ncbi:tyrosine-type recombinase/integrase [Natronobacterium gregoryi]|uniref:Phage integrase family protein n=2 Tax=Natronobacterium gregoryi TaxID=44930 RepID=L0AIP7_NATGS|nr:tyrosine-type recombinase/integrase [Natronobacterium gregoryi]AFZ73763.1 phage integrase family protein [Natronobacterium gregoryi SP2]PLK19451.1 recombinase XerD [Natronobacterium gregoryi SP2]SFJ48750.1 Phage integrase family protein [Natronobacterium gregoryi]